MQDHPVQARTCPGPSEVCQRPSGWSRGGMGEGHVVRWDQNITFWYKIHSPCLEEGGVQSQEHHPNREAWGWKHHALGVLFCTPKGDRTTAPVLRGGWMGPCIARFWPTTSFQDILKPCLNTFHRLLQFFPPNQHRKKGMQIPSGCTNSLTVVQA